MSMWYPPDGSFFETVWTIVREIPYGNVSTYGQIASMIPPSPGTDPDAHQRLSPRWVGTALRNVDDDNVPWHRVINSQGKISLPDPARSRQRELLEREGIPFTKSGKVDLAQFGWKGPDDRWLDATNLLPPRQFTEKPKQNRLF